MSTNSSSGEVFGEKVLYGAIVAFSVAILLVAVISMRSLTPGQQAVASVPQVAAQVMVASSGAPS